MPEAAICIIHHDREKAAQLAQQLESCTHTEVQIAALQLTPAEYADIAADSATHALIIEQELDPRSTLGYTGIDVAEHMRRIRPGLPIYLLASQEQDLAGREAIVEEIIAEDELLQRCPVYAQRILRAMGRYMEAMSEKDRRYRELVALKLGGELSKEAEEELASYRAEIELPFASAAAQQSRIWESSLREEEELLRKFSSELRDLLHTLR